MYNKAFEVNRSVDDDVTREELDFQTAEGLALAKELRIQYELVENQLTFSLTLFPPEIQAAARLALDRAAIT